MRRRFKVMAAVTVVAMMMLATTATAFAIGRVHDPKVLRRRRRRLPAAHLRVGPELPYRHAGAGEIGRPRRLHGSNTRQDRPGGD